MLAIRLQRVGRQGHAMYRLAVQESRRHPSSGRVICYVGTYDPHSKDAKIQVETAQKYLDNGAQPSPRAIKLLKDAGVKMPKWVVESDTKKAKVVRHADKLRKNQPKAEAEVVETVVAEESAAERLESISEDVVEASLPVPADESAVKAVDAE